MKHIHKATGLEFECGELTETSVCGNNKTYDMTVITLWHNDEDDLTSPDIVGYYFGEYDAATTDHYIDRWFEERAMNDAWRKVVCNCRDIVAAYIAANESRLDDTDKYDARDALNTLNDIVEFINNN